MQLFKKLDSGFFIGNNEIAQYDGLSLEARGLYFYMQSLPNDWHFSFERLAKCTKTGIRIIRRCIRELEHNGLLKREVLKSQNGTNTTYTLFNTLHSATCHSATLQSATLQNDTPYKESNITKKEKEKEINSIYSEPPILKANNTKPQEKKPKVSLIDKATEYYQSRASETNESNFSLEKWLEWIAYKKADNKNFGEKQFRYQFNAILKHGELGNKAIDDSIGSAWKGCYIKDENNQQGATKKPKYDPRKGNAGRSLFSDNPDDYINDKMPGVKRIEGTQCFEADLWKLTGRKGNEQ